MGLLSRILRWIDRRRAVAAIQQFARRRGLTPIEVAAVSRLVRMAHDTHGDTERAVIAGRNCVTRMAMRLPARRPLTGIVITLPTGRRGGAL